MARPIKKTFEETFEDRKVAVLRGQLQACMTKLAKVDMARELVLKEPWKRYPLRKLKLKSCKRNNAAMYMIADIHFRGFRLDGEHLLDIFSTIKEDINRNHYNDVRICFLGDDIEGLIHRSTSNTRAVIPMRDFVNVVVEQINQIHEVTEVHYIDKSNHAQTRPGETEASQLPDEDLGILAAQSIGYGLRPGIKFDHDEVIYFDYYGKCVCIYHGHQDWAKNNKDNILRTLMARNKLRENEFPDLSCGAHLHQFMSNQLFNYKVMACMPAAKHWVGDYEKNKSFYSTNQIMKITYEKESPIFHPIRICH